MKQKFKNTQKGITLVALVITIIVLLILAMVSIKIVMDGGLITKASKATDTHTIAAEKEKKRNLWMIIGGIVLAILAFIGNQVFQGIRNKRNQMRMMNMQQNIADKAEAEAKRQARNAIRTQRNRIEAGAKRKVSDAVRSKSTIKINGKSKKASI